MRAEREKERSAVEEGMRARASMQSVRRGVLSGGRQAGSLAVLVLGSVRLAAVLVVEESGRGRAYGLARMREGRRVAVRRVK